VGALILTKKKQLISPYLKLGVLRCFLINAINNNEVIKDYRLTGFCYGLVAGMNFGIYSHQPITNYTFFDYPVYSGLLIGLLGGIIGHLLEKLISKLKKQK
jgi:hypothetical protein